MEGSEKMIREVIQSQLCVTDAQLEANPNLIDLGCDDLDLVEMVMTIEDIAGKDINEDVVADMLMSSKLTVSEFVQNISAQISPRP